MLGRLGDPDNIVIPNTSRGRRPSPLGAARLMPSDDVTLGEVARRLDNLQRDTHGILERLDRDYVRADSVKEITRRVTALVSRLGADHPGAPLAVGGQYQHLAPAGCRRLGHRIAPAAAAVAQELAGR